MASLRKKPAQELQLDKIYLEGAQERGGFWGDEVDSSRPVAARRDTAGFDAVARPANDHARRPRRREWTAPSFIGSRPFWLAAAASPVVLLLFTVLSGVGRASSFAALIGNPGMLAGLAVIAAAIWTVALSAHREAVNAEVLSRIMQSARKFEEPSDLAEEAGERIIATFDALFADIDARMSLLDERCEQLAARLEGASHTSAAVAEASAVNMQNMIDASDAQRQALQRSGMMISTEMLPLLSKLETTVLSLESVAQNAGTTLETVGGRLQQSTHDLKICLDVFNTANHTVVPEIEKRMVRFEAAIGHLPEQLEATIGRLAPLSETVADAAMLSTANIEVIDQLSKDITAALDASRRSFANLSATGAALLEDSVEAHASRFRDTLQRIISEEAGRVSGLTHELDLLTDTAAAVVNRLQQPVSEISSAAEKALAGVKDSFGKLGEQVDASVAARLGELHEATARAMHAVTRDLEGSTSLLQTRLAAASTDVMQRIDADAVRLEAIIGETADRTSSRLAAALKDLPSTVAQHMDVEVARIDGALRGSLFGLSDQMRHVVDAVPNRLAAVTQESLQTLQSSLERSFESVAQRSALLSEQFRDNATQTTEAVLQGYVDFIFLSVERIRKELASANASLVREVETTLAGLPRSTDVPGPQSAILPQHSDAERETTSAIVS